MSSCGLHDTANFPVLRLKLVGRGEDAMRLEKRLRCAGRAIGARVEIDWQSQHYGEPVVYFGEEKIIDRLLSTEQIEQRLKPLLNK